jgi:uncharacterized OB-fold protein
MTDQAKPLPTLSDDNRPFWQATKKNELRMQQCLDCQHIRYPINHVCPKCLSEKAEWKQLSGRGEVFSYIVFHQIYHPGFAKDVPYNVAMIQLEEGPRMISNVVGVPVDQVKVGDKVEAVFDPVTEDITVPRFSPRK